MQSKTIQEILNNTQTNVENDILATFDKRTTLKDYEQRLTRLEAQLDLIISLKKTFKQATTAYTKKASK